MRKKIRQFIKTCRACQIVAPIRKNKRAPLQKVDVMATHAFADIGLPLDAMGGQLPRTKSGNQYALVVICNVSKWPTIIPLRNLRSKTIAEKLLERFSFTGLPEVIRSDNFSSLKVDLMTVLRRQLGIEGKFSAPWHAISHGSVERLNATVENVLRKLILERPSDWDRMIKFVNFALREVKHASTGFSPSELVYGRKFRGLLDVARESMEGGDVCGEYKNVSTAK